jgi:hypothetical protein
MHMKKIIGLLIFCFFISQIPLRAQVAINTDGSQPTAGAILDIKSTSLGLLIPRMSSAQRTAISTPPDGLLVYDTNTQTLWLYQGGIGWIQSAYGAGGLTVPDSVTFSSNLTLLSLTNSGAGAALQGITSGTGNAIRASTTNASNDSNTVSVTSIANGSIYPRSLGNASNFFMNNTNGVGAGVRGEVNSIFGNEGTAGVYGVASGTGGYGGYFENTSSTGFGVALQAMTANLGVGAYFESTNAGNAEPTVQVVTDGTGEGMDISASLSSNASNILNVTSTGPGVVSDRSQGNAGNFFMNNTNGVGAGVRGEVNSIFGNEGTAGVYGVASGTGGYGGYFENTSSTGFGVALQAMTANLGVGAHFESTNASNTEPTVQVVTDGTGEGMDISASLSSNASNILNVTSTGPGVIADHSQGNAGNFLLNNTNGVGAGVRGEVNSIFGNAGTAGVYGVASGTGGYAGYFDHTGTGGYGQAVYMSNEGLGTVMVADQEGTSGDIAAFQQGGNNKARISRTGEGFFDGGTTNSGADLAEAFDVEGAVSGYEPGDVLLISTSADRTVVKSNEAYSSLVAGVYATKPGVLLTEESASNSTLSGKVPMGVVGVIPTKVCGDGGPIHRGDILVTSARPGCAMKADLNKLKPGQAIGKALEEFNGATGKIKVLVNVK